MRFLRLSPLVLTALIMNPSAKLDAAAMPAPRHVALVFDDGPTTEHAHKFLERLAREDVRVTFAYVGRNAAAHPELARATAAAGHEIVNHSYTHPHLRELDDDATAREVRDTQLAVESATGTAPAWLWPPFLEKDARTVAIARAAGVEHYPIETVHLVSTDDWNRDVPADEIRRRATTGLRERTVILCHEWRAETLAELPAILAALRAQGCVFVTFSELLRPAAGRSAAPAN